METSDSQTPALAFAGVAHQWPGGARLRMPDLALAPGARCALLGPSGAGKSTLLSLAAGVAVAAEGTVRAFGQDLAALSGPARDRLRANRIGVIFQQFNLLPFLSARDNVLTPLAFAPERRARVADGPAECARLFTALGLDPKLADAPARALSVGQQQRVAAARALLGGPGLVLADEPTSALDPDRRDRFLALLFAEAEAAGAAVMLVTHDPAVAAQFPQTLTLAEPAEPPP